MFCERVFFNQELLLTKHQNYAHITLVCKICCLELNKSTLNKVGIAKEFKFLKLEKNFVFLYHDCILSQLKAEKKKQK